MPCYYSCPSTTPRPARLNINRDVPEGEPLSGTVEFQTMEKGERSALAVTTAYMRPS